MGGRVANRRAFGPLVRSEKRNDLWSRTQTGWRTTDRSDFRNLFVKKNATISGPAHKRVGGATDRSDFRTSSSGKRNDLWRPGTNDRAEPQIGATHGARLFDRPRRRANRAARSVGAAWRAAGSRTERPRFSPIVARRHGFSCFANFETDFAATGRKTRRESLASTPPIPAHLERAPDRKRPLDSARGDRSGPGRAQGDFPPPLESRSVPGWSVPCPPARLRGCLSRPWLRGPGAIAVLGQTGHVVSGRAGRFQRLRAQLEQVTGYAPAHAIARTGPPPAPGHFPGARALRQSGATGCRP